jgi:hypothetical protein
MRTRPLRRSWLAVCATALVLAAACTRDRQPATGAAGQEWFPLQEGAKWVYEVRTGLGTIEMEVNARGQVALREGNGTLFVMDERNRGPKLGFVESAPVGYKVDQGYHARFQAVDYDEAGKLRFLGQDTPTWFLPVDPKPGHSWIQSNQLFATPENAGGAMNWMGRVVGTGGLKVPAGDFPEALQVHIEYRESDAVERPTMVYDDWYARGVGLLRSVTHDPSGDSSKDIELTLIEYHFPAAAAVAAPPEPQP